VKLQFVRSEDQIAEFLFVAARKARAKGVRGVVSFFDPISVNSGPVSNSGSIISTQIENPAFHIGEAFVFLKVIASYP
jgi:hypothetical protein